MSVKKGIACLLAFVLIVLDTSTVFAFQQKKLKPIVLDNLSWFWGIGDTSEYESAITFDEDTIYIAASEASTYVYLANRFLEAASREYPLKTDLTFDCASANEIRTGDRVRSQTDSLTIELVYGESQIDEKRRIAEIAASTDMVLIDTWFETLEQALAFRSDAFTFYGYFGNPTVGYYVIALFHASDGLLFNNDISRVFGPFIFVTPLDRSMPKQVYLSILGDVDLDGKITSRDARIALRGSARLETLNKLASLAADLNCDKKVTAAEARKILRVSAKLERIH